MEPDVLLETDAKGRGNWVFAMPRRAPPSRGRRASARRSVSGHSRSSAACSRSAPTAPSRRSLGANRLALAKRALCGCRRRRPARLLPRPAVHAQGHVWVPSAHCSSACPTGRWTSCSRPTAHAATASGEHRLAHRAAAANATVKLDVREPAGLAKLAGGADMPAPLAVDAKLSASRQEQRADPITLTVGKTTATGRVSYSTAGPRPFLRAELKSPGLDLSGRPAAAPAKRSGTHLQRCAVPTRRTAPHGRRGGRHAGPPGAAERHCA